MQKEKIIPYLKQKIRISKNYSGKKLDIRLRRLEKVVSYYRLNRMIIDEELEELMFCGYIDAQKKSVDELMDKIGLNGIEAETTLDPIYPNTRVFKPDSELGKKFEELSKLLDIMLGLK